MQTHKKDIVWPEAGVVRKGAGARDETEGVGRGGGGGENISAAAFSQLSRFSIRRLAHFNIFLLLPLQELTIGHQWPLISQLYRQPVDTETIVKDGILGR